MKKLLFTKEQLSAAEALALQLRAEAQPEMTAVENMARSIQMRLQNVEAAETAQELCRGIQKFHTLYNRAYKQSLYATVQTELDELLSGMDEQEQNQLLTSILRGFAAATDNTLPEGNYDLDIMREAVEYYLCEYSIAHLLDPNALPEGMDPETAERLLEAYEKSSMEEYTALGMYILQATGEVGQIPAELTPAQIGTMTAASMKVNKAVLSYFLNKIDAEEFKKTMKLIAGVAALGLLSVVAWQAAKFAYTFAAIGFGALLAKTGIVNAVFVKLAGLMAGSEVLSQVKEIAKTIGSKTGVDAAAASAWDKIRVAFTGKLHNKVNAFWTNLRSRLGLVQEQQEIVEEEETEEETEWTAEEISNS